MRKLIPLLFIALAAHAEDAKPRPHVGGVMMMKPVVCKEVPEAKGKTGQDLANAIEQFGAQMTNSGYYFAGMLPGDPPIACFASHADPSKLPRGAR